MNERDIFIEALRQDDAINRRGFLEEACGADAALRQRIEALLQVHDRAGSFLEKPAVEPLGTGAYRPSAVGVSVDTVSKAAPRENPGTKIGPYKLLQQIGEGGMGTVWMAEQTHPVQRKVALKVIKPGMDSKQVVARFEAERQALALMDHPNIAKVLDAGTTTNGHPYFVMELVKGIPLTKFCDENHLTPRARLELFAPVCQAVQHAHQKGIIHRDLKPSNVLIALYDGRPVPKVIDFGVAKATGPKLTERTLFTELGAVVGTLEYMSPEQAELNNLDVDTRSDIYSLGVLLFELLTGTTPLEHKRLKATSLLEALRLIREEEPPRPSTRLSATVELPQIAARRGLEPRKLSGLVRGELDWIVMKALEKDRSRSYDTANGLAMDVQRYLKDEPVQACPPSFRYRLGKVVRRNKRSVLVTALVFLALLGGILGTTLQAVRATGAEKKARLAQGQAEDNLHKAQQAVLDYFTLVSEETLLTQPALEPLRNRLLQAALHYYQDFVRENEGNAELQVELAIANFRLGAITFDLGPEHDWLPYFQRCVEIMAEVRRTRPPVSAFATLQTGSYRVNAPTLFHVQRSAEALRSFGQARPIWEDLVEMYPTVPGLRNDLAVIYLVFGVLHENKQPAEAVRWCEKACAVWQKLIQEHPNVPHYRAALAFCSASLSVCHANAGQNSEAEGTFRRARETATNLLADYPTVPAWRELLHVHINWHYGGYLERTGRFQEAEEVIRQVVAGQQALLADYPTVPRYRKFLFRARARLADLLWDRGHQKAAAEEFRRALALAEEHSAKDADALEELVWLLATCPDPQFRNAPRAVELAKQAVERNPKDGNAWNNLGVAYYRAANWKAAVESLNESIRLSAGGAYDYFFLAMACWQQGDKEQARPWYDKAIRWMEEKKRHDKDLRRFRTEAEAVLGITTKGKDK